MRRQSFLPSLSSYIVFFLLLLFLSSVTSAVDRQFLRFFCHFFSIPSFFTFSFASGTKIYPIFDNGPTDLKLRQHLPQNAKKFPLFFYTPFGFLHQMSDVSATKSHERKIISAEKGQNPKSRRTTAQSGEKGRTNAKPFTKMPMHFTRLQQIQTVTMSSRTRTTMPKKTNYWTSTPKSVGEDRRHRSASESVEKSTERRKKLTNRIPPPTTDKHRLVNNSINKMRKGTKTTTNVQQQQKRNRGGGKSTSNWHAQLSSAELSISMMSRCQELDTRELLPSATTCRNLRSDKVCNYLFQEIDTKTGRRDVKCNLQGLEDISESCRKTCGICCEDINYACEDDQNGIVDCSRQLDKCNHKKWFAVLSRFCAGSCGLCAMSNCRDYDNSCRVRKSFCLKQESLDYMRENCARTCGFCVIGENSASIGGGEGEKGANEKKGGTANGGKGNSGKPVVVGRPPKSKQRLVLPECTDKVDNCTTNAHLCNNPQLGEYMIKFCTKTCLKCGETQTSKTNDGRLTHGPPPIELIIEPMMETNNENGRRRSSNRNSSRGRTRKCADREEKCTQWKEKGLCDGGKNGTTKFSEGQRKACAKTCGNCK